MINPKYFYFLLILTLGACSKRNFIHQGTIEHYQFFNFEPLKKAKIDSGKSHIWFKDSTMILENKVTQRNLDKTEEKLTYSYTFVDLKTSKAQNYYNFRDTAKPFCSFQFEPRFIAPYLIQHQRDYKPSEYYLMPDKIENGDLVKSVQIDLGDTLRNQSMVFYLKKSQVDFIFSGNPFFDKMLSPYKIFKFRSFSPYTTGYVEAGYKLASSSLDDKILAIFDTWGKNILESSMEFPETYERNNPCPHPVQPFYPPPLDHTTLE